MTALLEVSHDFSQDLRIPNRALIAHSLRAHYVFLLCLRCFHMLIIIISLSDTLNLVISVLSGQV